MTTNQTEKLTIELWCGEDAREALAAEAMRTHVGGQLSAFASTVINRLGEKLASEKMADRKVAYDALLGLGVIISE